MSGHQAGMLALLLATGVFGSELQPGTGELTAPIERIVIIPRVQSRLVIATGAPLGAQKYLQPYDPSDHGEYAIGFTTFMDNDETIADVDYIGVSAAGAALGIGIDTVGEYLPRITDDGRHVQYWPVVDAAQWAALAFDAGGTNVQVKARILTSKGRRWERSSIHEVRQL